MKKSVIVVGSVAVLVMGLLALRARVLQRTWLHHNRLALDGQTVVDAIEKFCSVHQRYPSNLVELMPTFLLQIPHVSDYAAWEYLSSEDGFTLSCHGQLPHCYVVYMNLPHVAGYPFWEENWEGTHRRIYLEEARRLIEQRRAW